MPCLQGRPARHKVFWFVWASVRHYEVNIQVEGSFLFQIFTRKIHGIYNMARLMHVSGYNPKTPISAWALLLIGIEVWYQGWFWEIIFWFVYHIFLIQLMSAYTVQRVLKFKFCLFLVCVAVSLTIVPHLPWSIYCILQMFYFNLYHTFETVVFIS